MGAISEDTLPIFCNRMLACHLQSPNMHIVLSLFLAKEKKDLMELTETLIWLGGIQLLCLHSGGRGVSQNANKSERGGGGEGCCLVEF